MFRQRVEIPHVTTSLWDGEGLPSILFLSGTPDHLLHRVLLKCQCRIQDLRTQISSRTDQALEWTHSCTPNVP